MDDKTKLKVALKTFERIEKETTKYSFSNINENIKYMAKFGINVIKNKS